jgi:2'-5' RNA ligase
MPDFPDHRVFFALQPDFSGAEHAHAVAAWQQRKGHVGGAIRPRNTLHVTLAQVGRAMGAPPQGLVDLARRAALAVRMRPFVVALDRLQYWQNGEGLLVLTGGEGVAGVEMLHDEIAAALGRKAGAFTAHMSLIWGARETAVSAAPPVRWRASEFVLIHSIQGQTRHDVVERFPLVG